jgi:hypothetical protein
MSCTGGQSCSNPAVSPAVATTYTVVVTDARGCRAPDSAVSIAVDPVPVVDPGAAQAICLSASATLGGAPTATGGTPPYSYQWSAVPADPSLSCSSGPACANPSATPAQDTTYTVTVNDQNGCAASRDVAVTVNVPAPPPGVGNTLLAARALLAVPPDPAGMSLEWVPAGGSAVAYNLRRSDAKTFAPPNGILATVAPGQGVLLPGEVATAPTRRFYRVTTSNCAGDESAI